MTSSNPARDGGRGWRAAGPPLASGRRWARSPRTVVQDEGDEHDTAKPPAASVAEQQARFDSFRQIFNSERPHEALNFQYPSALYRPSSRSYPCALREPEYGQDCAVRRVRSNGEIKWRGGLIFVSQVLVGEPVGVERTESGDWRVRYADVELGFIDTKRGRLSRWPLHRRLAGGLVDNANDALPTSPPAQQQRPEIA